jgi:hypothetical protein
LRSRIIARFELGEHAKHLEHRLAGRCGCVETLLVQVKVNLLGMQLAEESEQVNQAAT